MLPFRHHLAMRQVGSTPRRARKAIIRTRSQRSSLMSDQVPHKPPELSRCLTIQMNQMRTSRRKKKRPGWRQSESTRWVLSPPLCPLKLSNHHRKRLSYLRKLDMLRERVKIRERRGSMWRRTSMWSKLKGAGRGSSWRKITRSFISLTLIDQSPPNALPLMSCIDVV